MTPTVRAILANYESDNPGVKGNLARILMQGRLGGTGKLLILPVDQGFETWPGTVVRGQPRRLRPALSLSDRDRRGTQRLCRAAGTDRSRSGYLRRSDSDDS